MWDAQIFNSTNQASGLHVPQGHARTRQPKCRNNPGWHISKQMLLGFHWNISEIEIPTLHISISANQYSNGTCPASSALQIYMLLWAKILSFFHLFAYMFNGLQREHPFWLEPGGSAERAITPEQMCLRN